MEPANKRTLSIVNRSGRRVSGVRLRHAVRTVFAQHGARNGEVSILLTGDDEIADLNRRFRNLDEPTDVLTFPSDSPLVLGDVAISLPYAERQAQARGIPLEDELVFLTVHGALHLLGFDDETEQDKRVMMVEMARAVEAMGLKADAEWHSLLHGGVK